MANYLTTDADLTSVANAIRTKCGTSASLSFPSGFITAISNISSYSVYNGAHHSVVTRYAVTISLTNPSNADGFSEFSVLRNDTDTYVAGIPSATGNITITVDQSWNGFTVFFSGLSPAFDLSGLSCTGGVSFTGGDDSNGYAFAVVGDGTVTFDGIDWDD